MLAGLLKQLQSHANVGDKGQSHAVGWMQCRDRSTSYRGDSTSCSYYDKAGLRRVNLQGWLYMVRRNPVSFANYLVSFS